MEKDAAKNEIVIDRPDAKWTNMNIDDIWHFLGRFGKYQVIQLAMLLYLGTTLTTIVVNGMFTGKKTGYWCAQDNTSFSRYAVNTTTEVTSCWVKVIDNVTSEILSEETCNEYEYEGDGTPLSFIAEWDLVCDNEASSRLPQILTMLGMLVGGLTLPHLGDRFGRKKLLIGAYVCQLTAVILMVFVGNFGLYLFLTLLSGSFQQGVMVAVYSMSLEVMPVELRPFISFLMASIWTVSMCIVGALGYFLQEHSWRDLQLAYGLTFVPGLLCFWFLDESLRWLVINSKIKDADKMLQKACRMNDKDYDKLMETFVASAKDIQPLVINDDITAVDDEDGEDHGTHESFSFKILVTNKHLRKIALVMCFTWMVCSLTYYGLTLLSTSLTGNPYMNFFLTSLADFPGGIYSCFAMKLIGRKKTIMVANAVAGSALLLAVCVSAFAPSTTGFELLLVALPLVGKVAITGSFGTCWTYTPELYPTNLRNYGVGIASTAARFGASFSPLFTLLADKAPWVPGTLFASACFVSVFLMSFMPETKHRELPRSTKDVEGWFNEQKNRKADATEQRKKSSSNSKGGSSSGKDKA